MLNLQKYMWDEEILKTILPHWGMIGNTVASKHLNSFPKVPRVESNVANFDKKSGRCFSLF